MRSMNVRVDDLKMLPLRQRLQLVEDLWDSIAADLVHKPISKELQAEMNRRREEYVRDPASAVDWDVIRRRHEKKK
jgi:putative addiction module component (TIGR02574 family)